LNLAYNGVSLFDHNRMHLRIQKKLLDSCLPRTGIRRYRSSKKTPKKSMKKKVHMMFQESIASIGSIDCCKLGCLQKFPRSFIRIIHAEISQYDFQRKADLNLRVHREMHSIGQSKKIYVTIEGHELCPLAWRKIHSVSKGSFYNYKKEASLGRRAQMHGNKGMKKPRLSTQQAVATLQVLLEGKTDTMPCKSITLVTGKRVPKKVLPNGTKWKRMCHEVNVVCCCDFIYNMRLFYIIVYFKVYL
jgi:hypothetical protein